MYQNYLVALMVVLKFEVRASNRHLFRKLIPLVPKIQETFEYRQCIVVQYEKSYTGLRTIFISLPVIEDPIRIGPEVKKN